MKKNTPMRTTCRSRVAVLVAGLILATAGLAADADFEIDCKAPGMLKATATGGQTVFTISRGTGIGHATVRHPAGRWPEKIIVRVFLSGLEHFAISSGSVTLSASVLSHSGNQQLLHLRQDGKEGPQLGNDSEYWMEIKTLDAAGKPVAGLPPKDGWFEMTIPKALLRDAKELKLSWIDFYR